MEKVFSTLEEKVKTKDDLTSYLEEISSIKEGVYADENKPLEEKIHGDLRDELLDVLSHVRNKKQELFDEKESLENKKDELLHKEGELAGRKEEINHRLNQDISNEERQGLQQERKDLEYERRNIEEEVWNIEDEIAQLEEEINNLKNKEGGSLDDPQKQLELLESLEEFLRSFCEVKLTLALFPEREVLTNINDWLKGEIKKPVVLNIETDPNLVGGAVVEYEGRWGDFSLRKKMEEVNYRSLLEKLHE